MRIIIKINEYLTRLFIYLLHFLGLYWTTFETTKRIFNRPDSEKNSFLFNFFCGSVAGSVSVLINHLLIKRVYDAIIDFKRFCV